MAIVENLAGDPPAFGDANDRGKPHAGGAADDIENGRHRPDTLYGVDIVLEFMRHQTMPNSVEACPSGIFCMTMS
jgi:hypothetical protein